MSFRQMLEKEGIIKTNEHYEITDAGHRIFILHQHCANTVPKSIQHI